MQPDQIFVLIVASLITSCVTLSMFAQAWGESRKAKGANEPRERLDVIEARLARMEGAIESVAIEIERVAEGQRFTAKLLAERAPGEGQVPVQRAAAAERRYITPH